MSADGESSDPYRGNLARRVGSLPGWKRSLLTLSLLAGVVGAAAKGAFYVSSKPDSSPKATPAAPTDPRDPVTTPGNASGFMGERSATDVRPAPEADVAPPPPEPAFTERASGWVMRLGLSVFAGVVIGTMFRMFIKTAAVLAALVVGTIIALSYFNVLNVDFTTMKTNAQSASQWAQDQAGRMKDLVINALPSSTAAAVGFFLGFKR